MKKILCLIGILFIAASALARTVVEKRLNVKLVDISFDAKGIPTTYNYDVFIERDVKVVDGIKTEYTQVQRVSVDAKIAADPKTLKRYFQGYKGPMATPTPMILKLTPEPGE